MKRKARRKPREKVKARSVEKARAKGMVEKENMPAEEENSGEKVQR